jgi:hypothetical protein
MPQKRFGEKKSESLQIDSETISCNPELIP